MRKPTFEQAKAQYVHRFTMEHVPAWSRKTPFDDGGTEKRYYAPQFRTDKEWYDATIFPGEEKYKAIFVGGGRKTHCYTTGQTWPLRKWLDQPYCKT